MSLLFLHYTVCLHLFHHPVLYSLLQHHLPSSSSPAFIYSSTHTGAFSSSLSLLSSTLLSSPSSFPSLTPVFYHPPFSILQMPHCLLLLLQCRSHIIILSHLSTLVVSHPPPLFFLLHYPPFLFYFSKQVPHFPPLLTLFFFYSKIHLYIQRCQRC